MIAYVIGNGSSLKITPVHLLEHEFTIGCNRFDLLGLSWDPKIWVMADVRNGDGWWDWEDLLARDSHFLFRDQDREFIDPAPNVEFMERCEHIGGIYTPNAWHLPIFCDYGGSISVGMQAAVRAGATEIVLIGCDLYKYRGPNDHDLNHFHPEYCPYKIRKSTGEEMITPEMWAVTNRRLVEGHEIALASAGVPIYNATYGGNLEVYPRVSLAETLN